MRAALLLLAGAVAGSQLPLDLAHAVVAFGALVVAGTAAAALIVRGVWS